ncbi:Protein maelstrom [Nymphon striatum]|nr:Protein maelstrom [Nymphon striatum]
MVEQRTLYERKGRTFPGGLKDVAALVRSDWNQRALHERKGRTFPGGLKDVAALVRSDWNRLPPEERARYDKTAKIEREKANTSLKGKLTSDGRLITAVLAKESDDKNKFKNMVGSIQNWIKKLSPEDVIQESFYLISFNISCEILGEKKTDEEGQCIPNEIAILEYSIKSGIKRWYHTFIHPGNLPMGYAFYAQEHSDSTHQIPVNGHPKANKNYPGIWIHIKNFINQNEEKSAYPPVFTLSDQMNQTRKCIEWLFDRSCDGRRNMFRVYNLSYLLLELRMKAGHPLSAVSEATELLSSNSFQYVRNKCCEWHEELDCSECPLGTVKLQAYYLSDSLCHIFNVDVTSYHLPETVEIASTMVVGSALQHSKLPYSSLKLSENPQNSAKKPLTTGIKPDYDDYTASVCFGEQSQDSRYFHDFSEQSQNSDTYGASSLSESYPTDYSQSSKYNSEIEDLASGFSQASVDDFSKSEDREHEDAGGWTSVGRGLKQRRNKDVTKLRRPNHIGIGRGLLGDRQM